MPTAVTVDAVVALTTDESERLRQCEAQIEAGRKWFVVVGAALAEIRDSRLYRQSHETFDAYVKERWGFQRGHAYRLIGAAETALELSPQGDIPPTMGEKHLRPLQRFPLSARAKVWTDVKRRYGDSPTAADVENLVRSEIHSSREEPYRSIRLAIKRAKRDRHQARQTAAPVLKLVAPGPEPALCGACEIRDCEPGQDRCRQCIDAGRVAGDDDLVDVPIEAVDDTAVDARPTKGIELAHQAINALSRILPNDKFRSRAFQIVRDWIESNE